MKWMATTMDCNGNCASDDIVKQSTSVSFGAMACKREKKIYFFILLRVFIIIIFFFFFQNSCKGYSLHDYKLKNTQECTA
jgi:hypothetical protein